MSRKVEIEVYTFDELSDFAKDFARNWFIELPPYGDLSNDGIDDMLIINKYEFFSDGRIFKESI